MSESPCSPLTPFPLCGRFGDLDWRLNELLGLSRYGGGFGGGIFDVYILVVAAAAQPPHRSSVGTEMGVLRQEAAQRAARNAAR